MRQITTKRKSTKSRLRHMPAKFWEENKGVTDGELAEGMGVSVHPLREVRKELGARDRIAIMGARFDKSKGAGSFVQLRKMLSDPLVTLQAVGGYFGFTKAQASLYFQSIYGRKHRGCFPSRCQGMRKVPFYKGQIYQVYLDALELMKRRKFKGAEVVRKDKTFRIHVNGYVVSAHRLYRDNAGKFPHMHTVQSVTDSKDVDFFLCFTKGREYIIPKEHMTAKAVSVSTNSTKGKYERFLDNWGVLSWNF